MMRSLYPTPTIQLYAERMAYTRRTPEQRAKIAAQAKVLREAGATMAEIAREVRVPAPTLSQWAARDGWRVRDLEAAGRITYPQSELEAMALEPTPVSAHTDQVDQLEGPVTPEILMKAGEKAFAAAVELASQGKHRAASEQLQLGKSLYESAKRWCP